MIDEIIKRRCNSVQRWHDCLVDSTAQQGGSQDVVCWRCWLARRPRRDLSGSLRRRSRCFTEDKVADQPRASPEYVVVQW